MDNERPTIVAIDDQPVILHSVASELKLLYNVRPFTSGQTALEYLKKFPADLILLDFEMPDMSGLEVLGRLRAEEGTADVPVIVLTGSEGAGVEAEAIKWGASDFLRKPSSAAALSLRVRLHLELSAYRRRFGLIDWEKTEPPSRE